MSQTVLFKKVPLLSDLPRNELDYLAATLQIVMLQPGEVLFREGEPGESFYVVLDGQLEVLLAIGTSDEKLMAMLGPGEFVGEMSLLIPGRARTASVRAVKAARLWRMTHTDFDALLLRGDVADKGIPSAIFMARTHDLIMSEATHGGTPGEILRRANHHLIQLAQSDLFVTLLFGLLDCANGKFDFARAGHELPMLLTRNGKIRTLPHTLGQPVGILYDFLLDENSVTLPLGGTLLLFTDGLTDGRSPRGEAFGHKRPRSILAKMNGKSGQQVCESILQTLREFQSDSPQEDDITLLAIHRAEEI
jgi:hypothetical protein